MGRVWDDLVDSSLSGNSGKGLLTEIAASDIQSIYLDVSKNRGKTPKMDGENNGQWNTLLKWMILGYQYFWKNLFLHTHKPKSYCWWLKKPDNHLEFKRIPWWYTCMYIWYMHIMYLCKSMYVYSIMPKRCNSGSRLPFIKMNRLWYMQILCI